MHCKASSALHLYSGLRGHEFALSPSRNICERIKIIETQSKWRVKTATATIAEGPSLRPCRCETCVKRNLEIHKTPFSAIVNPPREGMETAVIDALRHNAPPTLKFMFSCMPATLAIDLKSLCQNGYSLKKCQPFDMFPQRDMSKLWPYSRFSLLCALRFSSSSSYLDKL